MCPAATDEARFEAEATRTLNRLFEAVETQLGDVVEADLEGGILTLEGEDGRRYVLNKHAPNRQLWLSSPVSGAHHFDFDVATATWVSSRGGEALKVLLAAELSELGGQAVNLD